MCKGERYFEWYDSESELSYDSCWTMSERWDAAGQHEATGLNLAYIPEGEPLPAGWPCTGSNEDYGLLAADAYGMLLDYGDEDRFDPECAALVDELCTF